jgi:hypothetical protein
MEICQSKDPLKVACAFNPKLLEALAVFQLLYSPFLSWFHAHLREQKHQISHHKQDERQLIDLVSELIIPLFLDHKMQFFPLIHQHKSAAFL